MFSSEHNHIWDEYQWESHINEMARRHEHLRELIESGPSKNPRWLTHIKDFPTKLDAVDAFIEEELMLEESYFPMDDEDAEEDPEDALFGSGDSEDWDPDEDGDHAGNPGEGEDALNDDEEEDDLESLFEDIFEEEAGEESIYDYASLENIAIYTDARDLAADLLIFNDSKPHYMKHPGFIHLVSETLLISTKLAAAYSMGFDVEVLGANIAYCKKALEKSNQTLARLQGLKEKPLGQVDYYELHRRFFELRNNIAVHIQETRTFFQSQI
ncbi:MAG: hypothetical protein R6U28_08610 [Cyclonatronaceae bacterium]